MFQRLFGKWKVWQIFALVALVAGMVVVTATIAVASTMRGMSRIDWTRSNAAPAVAGLDKTMYRLSFSRAGSS